MDSRDKERAFVKASGANVLGNILKIVVEGWVGIAFGSLALVADAAHSFADLLASLVVLFLGRLSFMDPDSNHPHGHQRIEPLTALFVGATIVALGAFLVYDTTQKILEGTTLSFSPYLVGGVVFAMVDMYLVYWYTKRTEKIVDSPSLRALAADCLNDIYTSMAAVVGVFGVAVGNPVLDPIAGGVVSILIIYQGIEIGRENIRYLVGSAPSEEKQKEILDTVRSHKAARGVHDFRCHYVGPEIEAEMHVEIDGDYTLKEAHDIEAEIAERVRSIEEVGDVHIHLDPAGIGEWKDAEISRR